MGVRPRSPTCAGLDRKARSALDAIVRSLALGHLNRLHHPEELESSIHGET